MLLTCLAGHYGLAYIIMTKRIISVVIALVVASSALFAQTPVERVITKYEDSEGSRKFIAQGLKMTLARKMLNATPVAPISPEVDELYVLKMQNVPDDIRLTFVSDLKEALTSYVYYGKYDTKNGKVDIYVLRQGQDEVEELVIYNPGIYSLNSLHGDFTVEELLKIK